jgi:Clustered mitochondria
LPFVAVSINFLSIFSFFFFLFFFEEGYQAPVLEKLDSALSRRKSKGKKKKRRKRRKHASSSSSGDGSSSSPCSSSSCSSSASSSSSSDDDDAEWEVNFDGDYVDSARVDDARKLVSSLKTLTPTMLDSVAADLARSENAATFAWLSAAVRREKERVEAAKRERIERRIRAQQKRNKKKKDGDGAASASAPATAAELLSGGAGHGEDDEDMVYKSTDWNERFQQAITELKGLGRHAGERIRIYGGLSSLAQDFVESAERYGKIIISEVYSPDDVMKTIHPTEVGGIAGGDKYIVNKYVRKKDKAPWRCC